MARAQPEPAFGVAGMIGFVGVGTRPFACARFYDSRTIACEPTVFILDR